ncbi:MAG: DUF1934 domain-containing protein [Clostridiales bacterium]|jgi:uncharacterized beta-barrel protein YwiB (DUF1934 family)|nr:DUF1934 domain-containing protein [Clostridiales bacterium]
MQENYLISIVGKQYVDGEKGEIQMTTLGSYVTKGKNRFIMYKEYDEDNPSSKITSILKIEGNQKVTLIRNGGQNSRLILEKGQRHLCHYDTGYGSMMVGVFANRIHTDLTDNGGKLEVSYSLDINSGLTSINEIFINIKEAEQEDVKNSSASAQ